MTTGTIFLIVVGIIGLVSIICATIVQLTKLSRECKHEWKTVREIDLIDGNDDKIGKRYIQQCVHCGDVRHVDCY